MVSADVATLASGEIFKNRYCVMYQIAVGGMGAVYACRDLHNHGQFVAVKVVQAHGHEPSSYMVSRFDNEIELTLKVDHPNVVRGLDYFVESGMIGFVTELVQGESIADYLEQHGAVPIPQALEFVRQICEGVSAIHAAGIIHRDLSTENILITKEGEAKIIDFGVAKPVADARQLTQHGAIVGNLHCVSPEYVAEGKLDRRSDVYALGVLAYMLITGKAPFERDSFIETLSARVLEDALPVQTFVPDCPTDISNFISRAMARAPHDRFQTIDDLLIELYSLKTEWQNFHDAALRHKRQRQIHSEFGSIEDQLSEYLQEEPAHEHERQGTARAGRSAAISQFGSAERSDNSGAYLTAFFFVTALLFGVGILSRNIKLGNQQPAVASASVQSPAMPTSDSGFVKHIISTRGETLSKIAALYTGDAKNWKEILKANPDLKPEKISIGQTVLIPRTLVKPNAARPAK